jgi:two-component system sensor histidine kinase PilS (NtrC family)
MFAREAKSEIETRLIWLMALRVVVVTAVLGSALTADLIARPAGPLHPFFFLVALTYFFSLVYAVLWPVTAAYRHLTAYVQVMVDLVLVTLVVYVTGGVESDFAVLYFIAIIAASIILYRRGGLAAASVASLLFAGLVTFMASGALSSPPVWGGAAAPGRVPSQLVYYTVFLNVFGFFTVAILTSFLSESLRRTGRELARTSDHLADLQSFNQSVIDSITSGLMTTDLDGRVNFFNASAENILGMSSSQAIGRTLIEILGEGPDFLTGVRSMLEQRRYCRLEGVYRNGRGEEITVGMSVSYLLFKGERRSGFLIVFLDLTEMRRLEREVRIKENLATMGEMAAGLAHEIRNPLASISGSVQVLKEDLRPEGEHSRLMDIIVRESDRLSSTLNEFLAYARPLRFNPEPVDLGQVVEETVALLRNSAEVLPEHEISVKQPATPLRLFADSNQMKQISWNLARNAIQAMPNGGRLEVELHRNGSGAVVMTFRDEGVGMTADKRDKVFKPFSGGFEGGTGLGLAIVYRIVQDYRGEIRFDSRAPRGTEVSVHFPAEERALA